MNVIHDLGGHLVLTQDFGPPRLPADLAGPPPLGPSAPVVNGVRRIPIPRSMRESYYLPRDIELANRMVTNAPVPSRSPFVRARVPSAGNK